MLDLADILRDSYLLAYRWSTCVDGPVRTARLSPDGSALAVAQVDGPITVFEARSGDELYAWPGHANGTMSIDWRSDGQRLVSGGQDATIAFWEPGRPLPVARVDAGAEWCQRVAFAPSADLAVSAAGKTLRTWTGDGAHVRTWPDRSSTVLDAAWRPAAGGAPRFAAVSYGAVGIYDPELAHAPAAELRWKGSSLVLAWSPTAKYLATGDQDASVHFWIMRNGVDLQMSGFPRKVRELAWDRTGRFLATGGGAEPCIWDCSGRGPEGTKPRVLEFHEAPVSVLSYQSRGDRLASSSEDGTIAVWEPVTKTMPSHVRGPAAAVNALLWSAADDALLVGRQDGEVACYPVLG